MKHKCFAVYVPSTVKETNVCSATRRKVPVVKIFRFLLTNQEKYTKKLSSRLLSNNDESL